MLDQQPVETNIFFIVTVISSTSMKRPVSLTSLHGINSAPNWIYLGRSILDRGDRFENNRHFYHTFITIY